MTRYYLSHLFHVHVLSKGTNLMQAIFFLYLYAHSITYLVHLQSVQKFAFNKIYLILLCAFKVMYSNISLVNHTDICIIFPDSMIIYMLIPLIRNEIHCSIEVDLPVL